MVACYCFKKQQVCYLGNVMASMLRIKIQFSDELMHLNFEPPYKYKVEFCLCVRACLRMYVRML